MEHPLIPAAVLWRLSNAAGWEFLRNSQPPRLITASVVVYYHELLKFTGDYNLKSRCLKAEIPPPRGGKSPAAAGRETARLMIRQFSPRLISIIQTYMEVGSEEILVNLPEQKWRPAPSFQGRPLVSD